MSWYVLFVEEEHYATDDLREVAQWTIDNHWHPKQLKLYRGDCFEQLNLRAVMRNFGFQWINAWVSWGYYFDPTDEDFVISKVQKTKVYHPGYWRAIKEKGPRRKKHRYKSISYFKPQKIQRAAKQYCMVKDLQTEYGNVAKFKKDRLVEDYMVATDWDHERQVSASWKENKYKHQYEVGAKRRWIKCEEPKHFDEQ